MILSRPSSALANLAAAAAAADDDDDLALGAPDALDAADEMSPAGSHDHPASFFGAQAESSRTT